MAGGRSRRMRANGNAAHKALLTVGGTSLAERNLDALLASGFRSLAIAVAAEETELRTEIRKQLRPRATAAGASLVCIVEERPLGTIGAVREIRNPAANVLVVNVDNLTPLDLRALVNFHRVQGVAMTIASHDEPFTMPFGELRLRNGAVEAYLEKPVRRFAISSGTYVLSRNAIDAIPNGEAIDVPQLFERLRLRSLAVAAFRHSERWIDVNDVEALRRAESLVTIDGN